MCNLPIFHSFLSVRQPNEGMIMARKITLWLLLDQQLKIFHLWHRSANTFLITRQAEAETNE